MPEVVKVKRPVSVWIAQELILGLVLLTILGNLFTFFFLDKVEFGTINRDLLIALFVGEIAFVVVGMFAYWASKAVRPYARFLLAVLLLSVNISTPLEFITNPEFLPAISEGTTQVLVSFAILLPLFAIPFIVLPLILLFSSKVKMFFDPSLIPQVDESSTIFHEPPPPPRFDE